MNESMSVAAAKHWATSVSYVEPILGMKSCTPASMLRICICKKFKLSSQPQYPCDEKKGKVSEACP